MAFRHRPYCYRCSRTILSLQGRSNQFSQTEYALDCKMRRPQRIKRQVRTTVAQQNAKKRFGYNSAAHRPQFAGLDLFVPLCGSDADVRLDGLREYVGPQGTISLKGRVDGIDRSDYIGGIPCEFS